MPPSVVKTMGRKARPWAMLPARCLLFFSRARQSNRWAALTAAAGECVGRRGQEMVTSMAVTEGERS